MRALLATPPERLTAAQLAYFRRNPGAADMYARRWRWHPLF